MKVFRDVGQRIRFSHNGKVVVGTVISFSHNFDGSIDLRIGYKTKLIVNSNDVIEFL